jgi:tripartite-type tricarboxylate transporter receptor subunit TctC
MKFRTLVPSVLGGLLVAARVHADTCPRKPITLIVPL